MLKAVFDQLFLNSYGHRRSGRARMSHAGPALVSCSGVEQLEHRILLTIQTIRSDVPVMMVGAGETVLIPVVYQTQDNDRNPAALTSDGISFNLHFDSSALQFVRTESVFAEGLQTAPDSPLPESDESVIGDDNNSATDQVLLTSYSDANGWPSTASANERLLYVAVFQVQQGFNGSSVKFSVNRAGQVPGETTEFDFRPSDVELQPRAANTVTIEDATPAQEGQPAQFTVRLSSVSETPVSVSWSTEDVTGPTAAEAGVDYESQTDQVLVFSPGQTEKTISITTLSDSLPEPNEEFEVHLSNVVGGSLGNAQAVGVIQDASNGMPRISVTNALTVLEGQAAQFVVTLDIASTSDVTVQYSTANGNGPTGAIADVDYVPVSNQTLTFAPGETRKTISVATISNPADQPRRSFELLLSNSTGAVLQNSTSIATIRDGEAGGAVLDVDVSGGSAAAQSDGLLVFAVLAGVTNSQQLGSLLSSEAAVLVDDVIVTVGDLRDSLQLDVDGNGSVSAQSDGLLVFAVLAGVTNSEQLGGLIGTGATRSVTEIIDYIESLKNPADTSTATAFASSAPVLAGVLGDSPATTQELVPLETFTATTFESTRSVFSDSTEFAVPNGNRTVASESLASGLSQLGAARNSAVSSKASGRPLQASPSVVIAESSGGSLQNLDTLFEELPEVEDWLLLV